MKTKIFKFFFRKSVCVFLFFTLPCVFCNTEEKKWTLAGCKFSWTQENGSSNFSDSVAESLPQLVLEQIAQNLKRKPLTQEILERKSFDFRKERLSLFLQLSKEIKSRDALVLQSYSKGRLKSKLNASDKKIQEIQKKLDNLIHDEKKLLKKYEKNIQEDLNRNEAIMSGQVVSEKEKKSYFSDFFNFNSDDEVLNAPLESVVLYGNDSSKLWTYSSSENKSFLDEDFFTAYKFQKACVDAGICGLLTGSITVYGSYIMVQSKLYQYPGGKVIANAVETGSKEDLALIARSIAMQLTPKISQSMPVMLKFEIENEDPADNISVYVDDVVYKSVPEMVLVQSGIHQLIFFAEGYKSVSVKKNFTGNRAFLISVKMGKDDFSQIEFAVLKNLTGSVFINGSLAGKINEANHFASVKINGQSVLGHFIDENGLSADFYVPKKLLSENNLKLNLKAFDKSKYIDVRRRWMYASYSALIVSLIPTFYCYGNYMSSAKAYNDGAGMSYDTAKRWETASNIFSGISIGFGGLFVYELFRYLKAANSVIPQKAKKISKKEIEKIRKIEDDAIKIEVPAFVNADENDSFESLKNELQQSEPKKSKLQESEPKKSKSKKGKSKKMEKSEIKTDSDSKSQSYENDRVTDGAIKVETFKTIGL